MDSLLKETLFIDDSKRGSFTSAQDDKSAASRPRFQHRRLASHRVAMVVEARMERGAA
jgi:hypothetical protein